MQRIAHILGETSGSAAERSIIDYYRAIDRAEIQFDFFLCKGSEYLPAEEIKTLGGRIFVLPPKRERKRYGSVLEGLLRENGYDIVQCHCGKLAEISLKAAKNAGVKNCILHCHSSAERAGAAKKYATQLLACCESAARACFGAVPVCRLNEQAPPVAVARLLPMALDISHCGYSKESRAKARRELNIPNGSLVFGSVGESCAKNNQAFLIDVFKKILDSNKNSVLVISEAGKESEYIKARIVASGVSDRIKLLNRAPDSFYAALDCFLLPQKSAGFPFSAVMAQSAGVYCILSDKISREVKLTDSAQFLSLKAGSADWACAALCCAALKNKNAAEQLKAAGYDIRENAEVLQKYYQTLRKS